MMDAVTTSPPALARCTEPGCPVRCRVGADRPCSDHGDGDISVDLTTRANGFGVVMTAFDDEHDRKDQQYEHD